MDFCHFGFLRGQQVGKHDRSWYFWFNIVLTTTFQAFRHDGGTMLSHCYPVIHRNNWLHYSNLDNEACGSVFCAVCDPSDPHLVDT